VKKFRNGRDKKRACKQAVKEGGPLLKGTLKRLREMGYEITMPELRGVIRHLRGEIIKKKSSKGARKPYEYYVNE
jgi:hypothetical protein